MDGLYLAKCAECNELKNKIVCLSFGNDKLKGVSTMCQQGENESLAMTRLELSEARRGLDDVCGNKISLENLCRKEPEWAANVIRSLKAKITKLKSPTPSRPSNPK